MEQDCEIGGLAYWFDLELGDGERLSNAPGAHPGSWSQCLLPVDPPIHVAQGTPVRGAVRRERRGEGGGEPGWMTWEIEAGGEVRHGHEFRAAPASAADLEMASPDGVPTLSRKGRVAAKVLGLTDGHRRVREIAASVAASDGAMSQKEAERLVVGILAGQITRG